MTTLDEREALAARIEKVKAYSAAELGGVFSTGLIRDDVPTEPVTHVFLVSERSRKLIVDALRQQSGQPNVQQQSAVPRGVPVCWRWRHSSNRLWAYGERKPEGQSIHLFEVEPLYASPPSSDERAKVVEAAQKAIMRYPYFTQHEALKIAEAVACDVLSFSTDGTE